MKLLGQILYFFQLLAEQLKLKKKEEKQARYEKDQNAIKDDPVKWSNDHFGVRMDGKDSDK